MKMSPEITNGPPTLTKRKKSRGNKKQTATAMLNDLNISNCTYFRVPDSPAYYSLLNYSTPPETMSLPVYPFSYPNFPLSTTPSLSYAGPMASAKTVDNNSALDRDTIEYASLPINNLDQNDNATKRRFSDPGLPNDSDSSTNSFENHLIYKLTQQVNALKESNRKLSRDLAEVKIELNILKQQTIRQYERDYEPGMLADVIREVRDAARVREDALLARVKHLIEEKQFSMNQLHFVVEKNRNNERLSKIEDQLKNLNINKSRLEDVNSSVSLADEGPNQTRQVFELEREALILRRELQDARAKKEESDKKIFQLDKRLSNILRQNEASVSETSVDEKTSADSFSMTTVSSVVSQGPQRITLSGPVTDL